MEQNHITTMDFKDLKIINIKESEADFLIKAEESPQKITCSHCGAANFKKFGKRKYSFKDIPINGKPVVMALIRQRYFCRACKGTFFAHIEDLSDTRNCTHRLIEFIAKQALTYTFVSVAKSVGVSEKTVRIIYNDFYKI